MKPAVVNLSYGTHQPCRTVVYAIQDLVDLDIPVTKAPGDTYENASNDITNTVSGSIVVGATDRADSVWRGNGTYGSAYGSLVEISAPGKWITHASSQSNNSYVYQYYSGTSYSAPMVAGVVARMLGQHPNLTIAQIKDSLYGQASPVTIAGAPGTAARVLYSGVHVGSGSTPSQPPSAPTITVSIDGYSTVRPNVGCYFFGNAYGGSTGDYRYVWVLNGEELEEDSDVLYYVNSGSSFTVELHVFDDTTQGYASLDVTVTSQAGECLVY